MHRNQVEFILGIKEWFNIYEAIIYSSHLQKKYVIIAIRAKKAFDKTQQ